MDLPYVFVVVATVLVGVHIVKADDMSSSTAKRIYCGRHLSQTLSTVCRGNYNTLNKKSEIYQGDYPYNAQSMGDPFLNKASAKSMFHRRQRRGVYNECCEKPCSHEELMSYCGRRRR